MALLSDLTTYLSTEGTGTFGVDLFAGTMPPTPNLCVALFESPASLAPEYVMAGATGGEILQRPRIQVQTRASRYEDAESKANQIHTKLSGLKNRTLSGVKYYWISALQSKPFHLAVDDQGSRHLFVCNYEVHREVVST